MKAKMNRNYNLSLKIEENNTSTESIINIDWNSSFSELSELISKISKNHKLTATIDAKKISMAKLVLFNSTDKTK